MPRSALIETGTMHPFDKCCLVPCDGATNATASGMPPRPPYKAPGVFTITHLREPLSWRQTEYFYAGAGSSLVPPTNATGATPRDDPALWAAWVGEGDPALGQHVVRRCGGSLHPVRGYEGRKTLHEGFGYYQPDFMVRNVLATCGCPRPFAAKTAQAVSGGDCFRPAGWKPQSFPGEPAPRTYLAGAFQAPPVAAGSSYFPPLGPSELREAMRVLAAFDAVVPMERLDHPLLPAFLLNSLGWSRTAREAGAAGTPVAAEHCPGGLVETAGSMLHTHSYVEEQTLRVRKAKRTMFPKVKDPLELKQEQQGSGAAGAAAAAATATVRDDRTTPPCVRAALQEQSALEAELYAWAVRRFDREMVAFEERVRACRATTGFSNYVV